MEIHQKYRILSQLNPNQARKFGKTFIGELKETGEKVLIKSIQNHNTSIGFEQLKNEAQFTFDHPQLPLIYDFYLEHNEALLVKKYVEGETLSEVFKKIKSKKKKREKLLQILPSILAALEILKQRKIVHCDIKPGNLILLENEVSIIDFGLAIQENNLPQRNILFPLGFAAPELLLNKLNCVDHRTDQYALGTTIWNLLSGDIPNRHMNPSIMTNLQLNLPLPEHSSIPKSFNKILNKMCAKHNFSLPPNKMNQEEVLPLLKQGISRRYEDYSEILNDFSSARVNIFGS